MHCVLAHIESDARFPSLCHVADDADLTDFELVLLFQHLLASFASTSMEDGVLAGIVYQKDTGVIETESVANQVNSVGQQLLHVQS